jgi:phosphohistidine phosphatase SixA
LKKKGVYPDCLWHSPKTRAQQTAQIFLNILGATDTSIEEKPELSPNGDVEQIYQELLNENKNALFVISHLPFLDKLTSLLLSGSNPDRPSLDSNQTQEGQPGKPYSHLNVVMETRLPSFPTSSVAAFELTRGNGKFLWAFSPESA